MQPQYAILCKVIFGKEIERSVKYEDYDIMRW